jgi:hypothetical protein
MAWPRTRRGRLLGPLVAAALVGAGVLALSGSSSADTNLGTVTVSPHTGAAGTNINLTTVSTASPPGCPDTASQATVVVTGPGGWAAGLSFTPYKSLAPGSEQVIPMSPSFAEVAAQNGTTIEPGRYDIAVVCKDRLGATAFGSYAGAIWFSDSDSWQDSDPSTTTTVTQIAIADSPAGRADTGKPVTLTASVTPASATGRVQFYDSNGDSSVALGSPVTLTNGKATLTTTRLVFGLHYLAAAYLPADTKRFAPAKTATPNINFVVAHPPPAGGGG